VRGTLYRNQIKITYGIYYFFCDFRNEVRLANNTRILINGPVAVYQVLFRLIWWIPVHKNELPPDSRKKIAAGVITGAVFYEYGSFFPRIPRTQILRIQFEYTTIQSYAVYIMF